MKDINKKVITKKKLKTITKKKIINNKKEIKKETRKETEIINSNNTSLFNLGKFRVIKENSYDLKEDCEKMKKTYYQTNPRYQKYNQLYFTAADQKDLNKYGLIPLRYFYSCESNKNVIIFKREPLFKIYKNIDYDSCVNTLNYMFNKFKKGVFVIIRNNKLVLYLPFSNNFFKNNWYDKIYFSEEEKRLIETQGYEKVKHLLNKSIIEYMNKHRDQYKFKKINFKREEWVANGCFFRNDFNQSEGDLNLNIYKSMFEALLKERTIPDVEFFINTRDFPILTKDYTEPYFHLFDSHNVKLEEQYVDKKMAPIFSKSGSNENADILFPNEDDWMRASNKFFAEGCSGSYHKIEMDKWNTDWKKKKDVCIFRGSATGCGITLENNMRLKAADLSIDNHDILDAGITKWNGRLKKYEGKPMDSIDEKKFRFGIASFITDVEKSGYKYILNIDGHVSACRLSSEFAMNSVILIVESDYKLWFSHLLVPNVHYIPVSRNLDNLISQLEWCKKNDKECKKIAKNGFDFYNKYLTKEAMFDYMQNLFCNINLEKNFKNLLDIKGTNSKNKSEIKDKSKKIAIITCFRDTTSDGAREKQRSIFIQLMNKLLTPYGKYKIYIIEQDKDGKPFNIGKLKNIGFEIASKEDKYDHIIFSDIDIIPDYDLMNYLFLKPKDEPISLAYRGTRYTGHELFLGTLISFSSKAFKKINGYPNNFWGWGGEDVALSIRLNANNINTVLYPEKGSIIDFEEKDNKTINVIYNKLKNIEKEELKYEKLHNDISTWKKNGLNSLYYDILNTENINENTVQIKVNLLKSEDEKKFKYLYPNKINDSQYKPYCKIIGDIKSKMVMKPV
jgi:hypothetical protein